MLEQLLLGRISIRGGRSRAAPLACGDSGVTDFGERRHGERGLHVRMALDNEGDDTPWTLDIRDQQVELPGIGRSQPQFAKAGVRSLPTITVPRRERRVIALYYPVPPNVHDADDPTCSPTRTNTNDSRSR
jgi:hypothetical protein